jgi:hypothetical protein
MIAAKTPTQTSGFRILRIILCILIALAMLLTTWRLYAQMRDHVSFFDQTAATIATGNVPIETAQYDMLRLNLAFQRDAVFKESIYFRTLIYNGLILGMGFLFLKLLDEKNTRVLEY